ncbi:MAG: hypothetical protein IPK10_15955 [Bacteroidetes bacterium]|nr:hypothetical protein [Bacteroidota bacterium]
MKKIILLSLYLIFSIQICSAQSERFKFTWTFHFDIASYASNCEGGFGLCFVPPNFNFRTVEAAITSERANIQFHLIRSTIHEDIERELLRLTQFPIPAGITLPTEVSRKLGFAYGVELKSGNYPIQISDDYITITCLME